jgi:hypothetical protein
MDYGDILTKAWKIIWKFKVLWIFGILSSCGQGGRSGGGGGGGNSGYRFSSGDTNIPPGMRNFFDGLQTFFDHIEAWQIAVLVIGLILFALIMVFITAAIGTVGRIGLIQGTVKAEDGAERMTFGELFNSGKGFFWRVFGFNFLTGLAVFLIILLVMLPAIGVVILTLGIGLLCLIPLICLLIPVGWLVTVIIEQVNIAIVVEDLKIIDGLKRGWEVFRNNIGNMIVMGLILGLGGAVVSFVIALPMIFVLVPAGIGIVGGSVSGIKGLFGGGIAVAILCTVTYLPVLILLGGILRGYIQAAWALTFLRLTGSTDLTKVEPDLAEPKIEEEA